MDCFGASQYKLVAYGVSILNFSILFFTNFIDYSRLFYLNFTWVQIRDSI